MFHVYSYYLVLFVPSYEAQAGAELAQEMLLYWLRFAMSNEFSFVSDPGSVSHASNPETVSTGLIRFQVE